MDKKENVFFQPDTLEEVRDILADMTEKSVILAGGTDLMIYIRDKKPDIDRYLSLCRLSELKKIKVDQDELKIGAMVTHNQAAEDLLIRKYFTALSVACGKVGSCQVRNKGTLGGNIMNASPAADTVPCICLFHGELEFMGKEGFYRKSIFQFLKEDRRDREKHQEILTAIYLPLEKDKNIESWFVKLGEREEVAISQISICACWENTKEGKKNITGYLGAVDRIPVPCREMENLEGEKISEIQGEKLAETLSRQITEIRKKRKKPSKLKITQAEQKYKERAVKGLLFDLIEKMNMRERYGKN